MLKEFFKKNYFQGARLIVVICVPRTDVFYIFYLLALQYSFHYVILVNYDKWLRKLAREGTVYISADTLEIILKDSSMALLFQMNRNA